MASIQKPLGLTAAAIYAGFSGILFLPTGFLLLLASQTPVGGGLFTAAGIILFAFGVFLLASVYGLWSLQKWGRTLTIWLSYASILLGFVSIFPIWPNQEFTTANTVLQLVGVGISLLIVWYLSKAHVRALFDGE